MTLARALSALFITLLMQFSRTNSETVFRPEVTLFDCTNGNECHGTTYQGVTKRSDVGTPFAAFLGIRFGKVNRRFKPAVAEKIDYCERDGCQMIKEGSPCVQIDPNLSSTAVFGQEDCLFLNVFGPLELVLENAEKAVRGENPDSFLPVLVWIHGGAFVYGSSETYIYGPDHFMEREVILVTINYRLSAFGFLSTEDPAYPGNMGLLDQTLALEWVHHNIKFFGGNPNRVTIFGQSAGGTSVNLHLLSPHSSGLFQGAIMQSGFALTPYGLQPDAFQYAKKLAAAAQCPSTSSKSAIISCLENVPAHHLMEAVKKLNPQALYPPIPFGPRVDKEAPNPFLPDLPTNLLKSGHFQNVPVMLGVLQEDGMSSLIAGFLNPVKREAFANVDNRALPGFLGWGTFTEPLAAWRKIKEQFFEPSSSAAQNLIDSARGLTEFLYSFPAHQTASLISEHVRETYAYVMDYSSTATSLARFLYLASDSKARKTVFGSRTWGTCHGDELPFLFKFESLAGRFSAENNLEGFQLKELMLDTWVNFAKTGNPNGIGEDAKDMLVPWPQYNPKSMTSRIYVLKPTPILRREFLPIESVQFWKRLLHSFGKPTS